MWLGGCARPGPWTVCSSGSTPDRPVMTGARGLLPALPRGGSGGAACGPSRPSTWAMRRESRRHRPAATPATGPRPRPSTPRWAPSRSVVPRDRAGSFTPRPVAPWAGGGRGGLDSMIIGLYAGGMTAREIRHHTGGSTIGAGPGAGGRSRRSPTRCAGAVMEWQRRPPGGLLPGDPPRAQSAPMVRPRPPGAGDARTRIAVGAGHGRRPSTWPWGSGPPGAGRGPP